MLKVGVVGLGRGMSHLGIFSQRDDTKVVAVCDVDGDRASKVKQDSGAEKAYTNYNEFLSHDMDIVGLTLRPEADGRYRVIGITVVNGKPSVPGVEPGDVLLKIENLEATTATMGTVVDALRGRPGDRRTLLLERDGERFLIEARVERFLPNTRQ